MVSHLEAALYFELRCAGMRGFVTEYRFGGVNGNRRWRFDCAYPGQRVAVEAMGGLYGNGKHSRAAGYTSDSVKAAEAQICGWVIIHATPEMIKDGTVVRLVKAALERKEIGKR